MPRDSVPPTRFPSGPFDRPCHFSTSTPDDYQPTSDPFIPVNSDDGSTSRNVRLSSDDRRGHVLRTYGRRGRRVVTRSTAAPVYPTGSLDENPSLECLTQLVSVQSTEELSIISAPQVERVDNNNIPDAVEAYRVSGCIAPAVARDLMVTQAARTLNNEIKNLVECKICLSWAWDPYVIPGCGHVFCGECLLRHRRTRSRVSVSCPTCNGPINRAPAYCFVIRQIVEALANDEGIPPPFRPQQQRFNWA
ncbi:hypothetical protein AAF712_009338 [Marasmius tenuissimus]|uniref:RING-type domain-containing protein n=1 Tax=Marasmius tenuissimus TaxID=585030 RepID=A0ABR2ZRR6_9AGAR